MTYAVFTRAKGTRFAYTDHFGGAPKPRELPAAYDSDKESPAAYFNRIDKTDHFVDVAPHIARELADMSGTVYKTFTAY